MKGFIEIPPPFLQSIASDNDRIPTLYYSRFSLVRHFFWFRLKLIFWLLNRYAKNAQTCLDFGGGGGVFLPSLSNQFSRVTLIDLETAEASSVIAHFKLRNIEKIQADILTKDFGNQKFDVIVAADVLEHFADLSGPVTCLKKWIAPHGHLATSLPTENWLYRMLRLVFKVEKPIDHYHTAREVERYLTNAGFKPVRRLFSPALIPVAALFSVTLWRLDSQS